MRTTVFSSTALIASAFFLSAPPAFAQLDGCPQNVCVESETSIVYNPQTRHMDAFATATTDYNTTYWYDLCVDLAVGRLNGPYTANATNLIPSGSPSCGTAASSLEKSGSVAATPGRQYYAVGLAQLRVYFEYIVWVPYPACGDYCNSNYYYDRYGYSQVVATQPSSPEWPSIVYSYPTVLVPVPVIYTQIAMTGSIDTAWSPPIITSVSPNLWPAGATTTVTISGQGFGYSPQLSISGPGVTTYNFGCAPPAACDTQIVASVTLDANTPGGQTETITVIAGGLNPDGWTPVPITGQSGQASAQATTQALVASKPSIVLGTACTGPDITAAPRTVYVGQQISFTACLPPGTPLSNVSGMSWTPTTPHGTAVGGFTVVNSGPISSGASQRPASPACAGGQGYCTFPSFYWVDQGDDRRFTFRYTLTNGSASEGTVTFNVGGPTAASITAKTGTVQVVKSNITQYGAIMGMGPNRDPVGVKFTASSTLPSGNPGQYSWVQLLTTYTVRIGGGANGRSSCPLAESPSLDVGYPFTSYQTNLPHDTAEDSPFVPLDGLIQGYILGEVAVSFNATMYLLWQPISAPGCSDAACTISIPLRKVDWWWKGDAVNTLKMAGTTTWKFTAGCEDCSNNPGGTAALTHPRWNARFSQSQGLLCWPMQ